jgi:Tol biopolymer transport system component
VTSGYDLPEDFSPDGSMIVFNRFRPADGRSANFVVGVRGGPVRQITGWQADQSTASWSPDGKWILTDNAQGALYVVHPDGTGFHFIPLHLRAGEFAFTPGWSPDGTKIIFGLYTGAGHEGIYTATANGTGLQRVTNDTLWDDIPDWGTNPVVP